jgi:hypothetical protein
MAMVSFLSFSAASAPSWAPPGQRLSAGVIFRPESREHLLAQLDVGALEAHHEGTLEADLAPRR